MFVGFVQNIADYILSLILKKKQERVSQRGTLYHWDRFLVAENLVLQGYFSRRLIFLLRKQI